MHLPIFALYFCLHFLAIEGISNRGKLIGCPRLYKDRPIGCECSFENKKCKVPGSFCRDGTCQCAVGSSVINGVCRPPCAISVSQSCPWFWCLKDDAAVPGLTISQSESCVGKMTFKLTLYSSAAVDNTDPTDVGGGVKLGDLPNLVYVDSSTPSPYQIRIAQVVTNHAYVFALGLTAGGGGTGLYTDRGCYIVTGKDTKGVVATTNFCIAAMDLIDKDCARL